LGYQPQLVVLFWMLLVLFVNLWQLQANQSLLNKHDNTWSLGSHGGISYNFCGNIHIITAQGDDIRYLNRSMLPLRFLEYLVKILCVFCVLKKVCPSLSRLNPITKKVQTFGFLDQNSLEIFSATHLSWWAIYLACCHSSKVSCQFKYTCNSLSKQCALHHQHNS